jgi:hypothetical protein
MKFFALILTLTLCIPGFAEEEGEGAQKDRVGPGKAVVAASQEEGIKLSEKAMKTLEIKFLEINGSAVSVPKSALIQFQDFSAIYRERAGWLKMVEVEPVFKNGHAIISSKEFRGGDRLVVENGGLLRVVELDIFGPEADACAD